MGFDCGFNAIKKFKHYTIQDSLNALDYIRWMDNPWNHEEGHYPTYEDYWKSVISYNDDEYPGEPNKELVEFYRDNDSIDLFSWGSWSFSDVDRELISYLKPLDKYDYNYLLENKKDFLDYLGRFIDKYGELIPVLPTKGIVYSEDETILRNIDGVMLKYPDGKLFEYDNENFGLYLIEDNDNYWISHHLELLRSKVEILDLNEYFVYYWRSY